MDNKILETIIDNYNGGPVGISTLATSLSENSETIEEVYEPFLIQQGFIMRTPRGRQVTDKGYNHLEEIKIMRIIYLINNLYLIIIYLYGKE